MSDSVSSSSDCSVPVSLSPRREELGNVLDGCHRFFFIFVFDGIGLKGATD